MSETSPSPSSPSFPESPGSLRTGARLTDGLRLKDLANLLNPQQALQKILETAVAETGALTGSFILINPNTGLLDIEASVGLKDEARHLKLRLGEGMTGWAATSGQTLRSGDVRQEAHYVALNPDIRSEMAVPLEIRGQIVGVLNLDHHEIDAFTQEDEECVVAFAAEAAGWLEHAWEIDQLRIKSNQLSALVDMGQMIVGETDLDRALTTVTEQANKLMQTKLCSLMMLTPDKEFLQIRACAGGSESYLNRPPLRIAESLVGVVARRGKALTVLDVTTHQRFQSTEIARQEGLTSLLAVPLSFNDNILGVLAVYTEQSHRFSNDEVKLLKALADLSSVAIEKGRVLRRVLDIEEKLRASERLSALGLLAAEIAHEIRNPLTVMQMLFHSLVESIDLDSDSQRDADVISEKMKQMNRILDQTLGFARSSEPVKGLIDTEALIDDITLLTRHKMAQLEITVSRNLADDIPDLLGDRSQVEQALLNLILNAADAMPQGGELELGAAPVTHEGIEYVGLSVRDTGEGMSAEQVESIFAPFLTYKESGTGIGLAMVQKIVENHQGKVLVESKPGEGTIFLMLFPIEQDA